MKKLIPDEKNWKDKLTGFFKNKGFFIILAICVIIVAATAIYVTTQNMNSSDTGINSSDKLIPGDAKASQGAQGEAKAVTGNQPSQETAKSSAAKPSASANSKSASKAQPASSKAFLSFVRPVEGQISKDFTRDVETFSESKTLGDIRAHMGLDFKVEKLTKVRAVADGVISKVETKTNGDIVVEINHGSGLVTRYAGLSQQGLEDIGVNQVVKANDIIGFVGDPIQSECEDGAHLHFEVLKNGKSVDPTPYLKTTK